MRTAAQVHQLNEARKNISSPAARAKLSASLKRRHRESPELMRRGIAAMQSPEARKKAAEAQRRPEQLVDRDPCPRCGVRGDIGCHHNRAPMGMRF